MSSATVRPVVMDMVAVPSAAFVMGSTPWEALRCIAFWSKRLVSPAFTTAAFGSWIAKELPAHDMALKSYWIGKYPVTNAQYAAFCTATGMVAPVSLIGGFPADHPVWGVSYENAEAFARWAGRISGRVFRLPTEAEWEFAARGLVRRDYPYGDDFSSACANTAESAIGTTTPVDRYERWASPFGVCDMAGNVEEWVDDRYAPYPGGCLIEDDLTRSLGVDYRILRGGSFARGGDLARCARRHGPYPSAEYRYTGFRIAYDADQEVNCNDRPEQHPSR